jgi:hypothetical protein
MPRRTSPSMHEKKITTMPIKLEDKNLPAIIPQRPSFLQTMKEGAAFGVGNAIAHRIIGSIPNTIVGNGNSIEYEKCMKEYDDKAVCERYK